MSRQAGAVRQQIAQCRLLARHRVAQPELRQYLAHRLFQSSLASSTKSASPVAVKDFVSGATWRNRAAGCKSNSFTRSGRQVSLRGEYCY
jgi:hypothetical protein